METSTATTMHAEVDYDDRNPVSQNCVELSGGREASPVQFRVGGKIFATLGDPDNSCGVVMLSPDEQHHFIKVDGECFAPVKGAWGKRAARSST